MKIERKKGISLITGSAATALVLLCSGCSDNDAIVSSGTAIDGYLQSAVVCVDLDENKECSSAEPRNNTNSLGQYSVATMTAAPLVVDVVPGVTTDSPVQGTTGTVITEDFFLTAPIDSSTITPLTTLVQVGVEQGIYSDFSAGSAVISAALNVPQGTDLQNFDYISVGNARVTVAASIVTQALADAITNIESNVSGDIATTENIFETAVKVLIDPSIAGGAGTSLAEETGSAVAAAVPEGSSVSEIDLETVVGSVETAIENDSTITSASEVDSNTLTNELTETNAVNEDATGAAN